MLFRSLYISAHPLDKYELYLSEQTQPLTQLIPEYDSRTMTIGGIISTVRTIVTKSGTKMAFVGLEDKFGEGEVIIFPSLFEQIGAKLVQDSIVQVTGKNSARDRSGNLGDESKLIADEVVFISDEVIKDYESTGQKISAPKVSSKVKQEKRSAYRAQKMTSSTNSSVKTNNNSAKSTNQSAPSRPVPKMSDDKLFLHVKNPSDQIGRAHV